MAWRSVIGDDWTSVGLMEPPGRPGRVLPWDVAASAGRIVALDGGPSVFASAMWRSADGTQWDRSLVEGPSQDSPPELGTVVAVEDGFLAVGSITAEGEESREAVVLRSSDGASRERAPLPVGIVEQPGSQSMNDVIVAGSGLVAGGESDGHAAIWATNGRRPWAPVLQADVAPPEGTSRVTHLLSTPHGTVAFGSISPVDAEEHATAWFLAGWPAAAGRPLDRRTD